MCVPNFIQVEHLSAWKGWGGKKWSYHIAQTSRDARPTLLPFKKSWVKGNFGSWHFTCSLVNYLHYVCAKFHPNRTTFSVKRLARKKVVKPERSNFTRCWTNSASNHKILSQGNVKCWHFTCNLVNYLHYVCAKFHPNRTTFRVKRLARKKVVKPRSTNFSRCSTYSASKDKILGQVELKKMKHCM